MGQGAAGLISVILPTYNRALFLTEAFASIAAQWHRNWELIVVDDGSTDETSEVLDRLVPDCPGPVRVVRQPNAGAYAARNTGLDQATGDAVAFFDSDDLWLPHHLERCAQALVTHPEVDWVFGACRMVDMDSNRELAPTTIYVKGRPRPFLSLRTLADGELRVIDDERATAMQIEHGLYCGLQNSVVRRSVFEHRRFWSDYLVVEDEMFVIRLLAAGGRFAYFDNPHVVYRVHADNSSGSATGQDTTRQRRIFSEMVRGLERVGAETPLSSPARRALARRVAHERGWGLGYSAYWQGGDVSQARACYRQALRDWPWSPAMWKTFAASFVKSAPNAPTSSGV
jgi:glycosyltransferase involved in cell wall biosynthesis